MWKVSNSGTYSTFMSYTSCSRTHQMILLHDLHLDTDINIYSCLTALAIMYDVLKLPDQ